MNKDDSKAMKIISLITMPIGLVSIGYFYFYLNSIFSDAAVSPPDGWLFNADFYVKAQSICAVFFGILILLLTINLLGLIIPPIGKKIDSVNIKYIGVAIIDIVYICLSVPVLEVIWFIMLFVDMLRVSGWALVVYLVIQIPMLMSLVALVIKKCNILDIRSKQHQETFLASSTANRVLTGLYNEFLAPPENMQSGMLNGVQPNYQQQMQRPVQNGVQPNYQPQMQRPVQNGVQPNYQQQMQRPIQNGVQPNYQPQMQRPVQNGVQQNFQQQTQRPVQNGALTNTNNNVQSMNMSIPDVRYDHRMGVNNSQNNASTVFIPQSQSTAPTENTEQTEKPKKESYINLPYDSGLDLNGNPVKKPSPPVSLFKK